MAEKTVHIPEVSCHHCINNIKREVGEIAGVASVEGDPQSKDVKFVWAEPADWGRIEAVLKEIGYPPQA